MENKETILKLYKELVEMNVKPTEEYYRKLREYSDYKEKFIKLVGREEELDILLNLLLDTEDDLKQQMFIEGYSLGTKLTAEALYNNKNVADLEDE